MPDAIRQIVEQTWRTSIGVPPEWSEQQARDFFESEADRIAELIDLAPLDERDHRVAGAALELGPQLRQLGFAVLGHDPVEMKLHVQRVRLPGLLVRDPKPPDIRLDKVMSIRLLPVLQERQ